MFKLIVSPGKQATNLSKSHMAIDKSAGIEHFIIGISEMNLFKDSMLLITEI